MGVVVTKSDCARTAIGWWGLRTGCSFYQERLRQNREWLVGGLELGVVVTKSDCARTASGWWGA